MMRSRGDGDEIRASTYQYHPRYLLYRVGSPWHAGDLLSVHRRLLALAPEAVRPGLEDIWHGRASWPNEDAGILAARWIEACGLALGVRTPNPVERARTTGRGQYLLQLGLSARLLYDVTGDHFDPDALLLRIARPMRDWSRGVALAAPPPARDPAALLRIYAQVRRQVRQMGHAAEETCFPRDLRGPLLAAAAARSAAQGGRGGQ